MEKIKIKICLGTACVVLGGLDPQTLADSLPKELADIVEVEGSNCLAFCKDKAKGKPPFVLVGDVVIERATSEKILSEINKQRVCYES